METESRTRTFAAGLPLALVVLFGSCGLISAKAQAGMYPVEPGEIPQLQADEGLLVVALDTNFPIEASFMRANDALLASRVLEEAGNGRTSRLMRVPAGRYGWHSLRIGDWARHWNSATFNLADDKELQFDVRPGVINYAGDLVVRGKDRTRAYFRMPNHGLLALDWLDASFPDISQRYQFVYTGHYADPFPAFYREALKNAGKRTEPYSKLLTPPDPGPLPLKPEVLWQQGRVVSIEMNNSGDLLAMQLRDQEKNSWTVEIIDLKASESHSVARTDIPFEKMEWSGDETLLLSLKANELRSYAVNQRDSDEIVSLVRVATDRNGKRQYEAWKIPRRGRVLDVLPEDPSHVLFATIGVSGYLHVHKLDISSQEAMEAFRPELERSLNQQGNGEEWWFADGSGNLSVARSIDGADRVFSRPEGKRLVEFLRLNHESGFTPVSVSVDGKMLYAISDVDRDQRDLVEYDIASRKVSRTLFSKPGVDVDTALYDLRRKPIGVRYYENGRLVSEYFEAQNRQRLDMLNKAFPGQSVVVFDRSADDTQLMLLVESSESAPKYYHLDTVKGRASLIEDSAPWLASSKMAPSEVLSVKSKDGLQIEAYLTLPEARGKRPLIVMPHGGPVGISDTLRFDRDTQFLASLGYAVLRVNYRGSGGYGKSFREAGHGQFGAAIEDDVDAALSKALAEYPLDSDRMCVLGFSYGGYSAMIAAVRWPERFRCVVSIAGIADRPLHFSASDSTRTAAGRQAVEKIMGDPATQMAEIIETSPLYHYSEIRIPIMLGHGLEDQRVDYEQSRRMQRMLDLDGRPVVGLAFENEGHGLAQLDTMNKLWTGIAGFLKANLSDAKVPAN